MKHNDYMQIALQQAHKAFLEGEVPVGAVIIQNGKIIASAHNLREQTGDATAHAEILAIREACRQTGNWRLNDATIYVTLEPCPMCAGAIVNAHIHRLIFGAYNSTAGGAGSLFNITHNAHLNHRTEVIGGIMEEECQKILKNFIPKKKENL